ncbi:hypothetical protein [Microbulbifer variabilis]|uniref:hypothetical protein n=1 Tax=Microbulbifer variabilis TaxID=266805 RepID=UPI001CFDB4E0|nr:hypothetical protein [Microbulbifer variabilis]
MHLAKGGALAATLSLTSSAENGHVLVRVMDEVELAAALSTQSFSIDGNPSGFTQKQFWTNITQARAFVTALGKMGETTSGLTAVYTRVSDATFSLGVRVNEPGIGTFLSYDAISLQAVNADAKRYGIHVIDNY